MLFWVLKLTVGKEIYDVSTHSAWIKIYSRMLSIILPIVVKYELEHKDTVHRVDAKRMHTFITPTAENSMAESVLNGGIRPAEDLTGIAQQP